MQFLSAARQTVPALVANPWQTELTHDTGPPKAFLREERNSSFAGPLVFHWHKSLFRDVPRRFFVVRLGPRGLWREPWSFGVLGQPQFGLIFLPGEWKSSVCCGQKGLGKVVFDFDSLSSTEARSALQAKAKPAQCSMSCPVPPLASSSMQGAPSPLAGRRAIATCYQKVSCIATGAEWVLSFHRTYGLCCKSFNAPMTAPVSMHQKGKPGSKVPGMGSGGLELFGCGSKHYPKWHLGK